MLRSLLLAGLLLLLLVPQARAAAFAPPGGGIFHGVAAGSEVEDFTARSGKRPAVWQHFIRFGDSHKYALRQTAAAGSRLMVHLSTAEGQDRTETVSPDGIARGEQDGWLVTLNGELAATGLPSYVRPFGEANNCRNAYAALSCTGARRDADHTAGRLVRAFRRTAVVLRGGSVTAIDAELRRLGMPPLRTELAVLPRPEVALVWSPMTGGKPNVHALRPGATWPGAAHVDWVGTSFYSAFPNFRGLERFYRDFAVRFAKPFAFAEWAMWRDGDPRFVRDLFAWVSRHPRTRMLVYNQGYRVDGPFRLAGFPAAAAELRRRAAPPRYVGLAP